MKIEIGSIGPSGRAFEFLIRPEVVEPAPSGFRLAGPARISGIVTKSENGAKVTGSIEGAREIQCTRCLVSVENEVSIEFSVEFIGDEAFDRGENTELGPEDLVADVIQNGEIDLLNLAREQILLDLPEQYFCKPDCKGLCERCGADLNLIDCTCTEVPVDPRWDALRDLK